MAQVWKTVDGNTAAAHVAYAFSDVAAIYPITPSSPMGEQVDEWAAQGRRNLWGEVLRVAEMQSEGGAVGVVHGALAAGAFTTTFTASQGLLLMLPNMFKISGELMPCVFHVAARAIAGQALSIFGDHQDVMATRAAGWGLLASSSVQEVHDLGIVAHLAAMDASLPFIHFFDGFRTSHEIQKVALVEYEDLARLINPEAVRRHRDRALNPEHPHLRGSAQNPDIYFQATEAANRFHLAAPDIVQAKMDEVAHLTGRQYHLFDYVGDPRAERVIVAMGSSCETIHETVEHLVAQGEKVGCVKVRLYRPFAARAFLAALPATATRIAVLDRTKEAGSFGEPLYLDVAASIQAAGLERTIVGGRYGLGSKEFTPGMVRSVLDNLKEEVPHNHFTVGIVDDITHTNLPPATPLYTAGLATRACLFWGQGGDGTVGANRDTIKIIGDNTDKQVQAYFSYDSHKSGGVTVSHLRFGDDRIRSSYLIDAADYIAISQAGYLKKYDVLEHAKPGATMVLNAPWTIADLETEIPGHVRRRISELGIRLHLIDALAIAEEFGLGGHINTVMQTSFFQLAGVLPVDQAITLLKQAIAEHYGLKGQEVVDRNLQAVDAALSRLVSIEVPPTWAHAPDAPIEMIAVEKPTFITGVLDPIAHLHGDKLPVSAMPLAGRFPAATSRWEKRGIATTVPEWVSSECTQCNLCAYVCPHAAIRPYLLTPGEEGSAPSGLETLTAKGKDVADYTYRIQVAPLDCTGCTVCVTACPTDALVMQDLASQESEQVPLFEYLETLPNRGYLVDRFSLKGSQFQRPLLEFSGACAGCGETPYVKAITQLFGDRMMIANATGCSSIWGGSSPINPWAVDAHGHGPAWGNSLFEDNAEYGFGMLLATETRRAALRRQVTAALERGGPELDGGLTDLLNDWLKAFADGEESKRVSLAIQRRLADLPQTGLVAALQMDRDLFTRPSHWIIGGDGWAYDIGFGGLDHVLAMGEDVNILVMDTEVYSNTGGQSSKASPLGSVARFATSGKRTVKKDLGRMAMTYGNVYVASVAMGANKAHYLRVLREAEEFPGPSLIIAYTPCIVHGIKAGMGIMQDQEKKAVSAGYWFLWRHDPRRKQEGLNPFVLDSKEPKDDLQEFLMSEVRFHSLTLIDKEMADELHGRLAEDLKERYALFRTMAVPWDEVEA